MRRYFESIRLSEAQGFICEVNLAEFMYTYARRFGWDAARTKVRLIRGSRISFPVIDEEVTEQAARLKLLYNHLSLGDCYLLAMAISLDSSVLTTDGGLRDCDEVRVIHISPNP